MEQALDDPAQKAMPDIGKTGARIVDGARRCFERYGIEKTTIEDIARAAGVSRPTVYKFFGGKMDIVDCIGFAELDKIQEVVRARVQRHQGFADTTTEAIVASVQVASGNPYIRRFVEDLEVSAQSQLPTSPYQEQARHRWESVMQRAQASGELAADLDPADVVSWLSRNQVMLLRVLDQFGGDEAKLRHMVRRFVVEPLLANRSGPSS
ncbi:MULTISPECIES: TetR/AcrR family transcriptional regulator [unclassified Sphingopyxis]|uniref:TetR/AcrR family transcriptional regulator n=1 Tax=unclassified Sphingopyxis TaxID=2614943 RepID=UPI0012E369B2|nr:MULTISPECIES: TetR/AcrR family transcriptional regulator [unclassified Sphingopyxis]